MRIFSAAQLYEAEKFTIEKQQLASVELMERAGTKLFEWLDQLLKGAQAPIHIFCGIGNNGGDGLVVARLLIENGYSVQVYIANFTDKRSKNFLINYGLIKEVTKPWPLLMDGEEDFPEIKSGDFVIDALFGIGLNRSVEGWVKRLIGHINKSGAFVVAIDIPSGLFANAAVEDPEAIIRANHTLTFHSPKLAFFLPESGPFVGGFHVLDIGLETENLEKTVPLAQLIAQPQAKQFYKQREKFSHKGSYGHSLIIAGSYGKMGAATVSATAAFRAGAGLVTVFVPKCGHSVLQTALPEAMVQSDVEEKYLSEIKVDFRPAAIGIGMGIGTNEATIEALRNFFSTTKSPMIIDADALNCISKEKSLLKSIPENSILTPHPKELERLVGPWKNDYEKLDSTKAFSKKHKVIVVIKGAHTVTVLGESLYVNTSGNPGMATAGSGDALSGLITGLLAQGYDPLLAAVFGLYLHGRAGDLAAGKLGFEAVMATDIIENIGNAYQDLFATGNQKKPLD